MQNSLFAKEEFINISRKFVCVRLESFESIEYQALVRKLLKGRFANTAFAILKSDGETLLSRAGRSPQRAFNAGAKNAPGSEEAKRSNAIVLEKLQAILALYPNKETDFKAIVQDFHSFKQALNVASGDQRLLVYTVGADKVDDRAIIKKVANDKAVIGRYHFDFSGKLDADWSDVIIGDTFKKGVFIIQPGEFGQEGKILAELSLLATKDHVITELSAANQKFAKSVRRKVYVEHLAKGRKSGIKYENNMPWGEDRNADGKIDD